MSMRRSSITALALFASLALLAAGCGGKQQAASTGSGAQFVRADALAFVSVDTDFGSGQWQQLDALAQKFPGRDMALASIERNLGGQGLDFDKDVRPALGPELDFAAAGSSPDNTTGIGLLQPADESKFKALVEKENQQPGGKAVYRKLDNGWYATPALRFMPIVFGLSTAPDRGGRHRFQYL